MDHAEEKSCPSSEIEMWPASRIFMLHVPTWDVAGVSPSCPSAVSAPCSDVHPDLCVRVAPGRRGLCGEDYRSPPGVSSRAGASGWQLCGTLGSVGEQVGGAQSCTSGTRLGERGPGPTGTRSRGFPDRVVVAGRWRPPGAVETERGEDDPGGGFGLEPRRSCTLSHRST